MRVAFPIPSLLSGLLLVVAGRVVVGEVGTAVLVEDVGVVEVVVGVVNGVVAGDGVAVVWGVEWRQVLAQPS